MKKIINSTLLGLAFFLTGYFIVLIIKNYQGMHISCSGSYVGTNGVETIKSRVHLASYNDKMENIIDGEIFDGSNEKKRIRRVSLFTFTRDNNNYHFINRSTSLLPDNNADVIALKKLLPGYLFESGSDISLGIYRLGDKGYILTHGNVPILYCEND